LKILALFGPVCIFFLVDVELDESFNYTGQDLKLVSQKKDINKSVFIVQKQPERLYNDQHAICKLLDDETMGHAYTLLDNPQVN
jgi:hypothetical protein